MSLLSSLGLRRLVAAALFVGAMVVPAGEARRSARPAPGHGPIETGIYVASDTPLEFARGRRAGAGLVRISIVWSQVAPTRPPSAADARDPGFAGYNWSKVDRQLRLAAGNQLTPLVSVLFPPGWAAEGPPKKPHGPWNVDAGAFADFARAAAARYSGSHNDLPRVRLWMAWNEPNLGTYLNPQFRNGRPHGGTVYRALLNAFADGVRSVRRDNLVIAGGTAPFTAWSPRRKERWGTSPLAFMRNLLCLSRDLERACSARAKFDIWAHHPYTTGGPTHSAFGRDDVSLGDLAKMRATLDAAVQTGRVLSRGRPRFWVTEFSWDTKPPDPGGVPAGLHARWVSEAVHQMWKSGVSAVIWLQVRDGPYPASPFQAGLYYRDGRAKPALQAYRFPFVAYPHGRVIAVWGRTPLGRPARVRIEQRTGSGWSTRGVARANAHGTFAALVPRRSKGAVRARLATGEASRPFALSGVKDRRYYPFGSWHP